MKRKFGISQMALEEDRQESGHAKEERVRVSHALGLYLDKLVAEIEQSYRYFASERGRTEAQKIDRLMEQQKTAKDPRVRKRLYDRVQEIVATELPIIPLVSPNLIVGVRRDLGNFRPAVLDHYSLWNVEDLYWRTRSGEDPR
jgi:ABC-type transport system substrate-binding protein